MNINHLDHKFACIGARVKIAERPTRRRLPSGTLSLDVQSDRRGEYFELVTPTNQALEVQVLDAQPRERHLLLLVRENGEKHKYLCGHDERHWFIAGVPERAPVGTVRQAKEALKPPEVRLAQARCRLKGPAQNRRKNAASIRQGEWFFVPVANLAFEENRLLHHEPLRRSNGGKPHWMEFCYRTGGESVYVCARHPSGVTEKQYQQILKTNPKAKSWSWQIMRRNPGVYVRGRVRHADHRTIYLHGWHQVFMNTEGQSHAMRNVAFLD